ncbi:hypothetical protein N7638_23965 [Achromobacter mucicolens]|nr:hypothetical protein [Achromobacter mucicolens]MDG9971105.1 hypothetical protein [Achromobacter mucicolens]WBX86827.1 hypothetical protein PE062_15285 [Achromobacter mucicolens]
MATASIADGVFMMEVNIDAALIRNSVRMVVMLVKSSEASLARTLADEA